jgi:mannose-6-phosphate isomerase-like protein (cupin superfamily)
MRAFISALGFVFVVGTAFTIVSAEQPAAPQDAAAQGRGRAAAPGGRGGRGGGRGPANQIVWSPKEIKPARWVAPNKVWTKLSDVLAAHKGKSDWAQTIVSDDLLHADYVSMGAGKKTARRMNADTREWWIVQDGQIRFTIDGQEPFVASKGFLVQVPYRTMYEMETVGDTPSLRFEVNVAHARKMYPIEETPEPLEGFTYVRTRIAGKGAYDDQNRMVVNFNNVVAGTERAGTFVSDARGFANIIIGNAQAEPAPTNKGHFHEESGEFWLVMLGKIRYRIEDAVTQGVPEVFEASEGDIVYAPKQTWHLASFGGEGRACRLAMNGYPDLAHAYEQP